MPEWNNVLYSDSDIFSMQQEALRRVRQMQQRARQNLEGQAEPVAAAVSGNIGAPPRAGSMPGMLPEAAMPPEAANHQNAAAEAEAADKSFSRGNGASMPQNGGQGGGFGGGIFTPKQGGILSSLLNSVRSGNSGVFSGIGQTLSSVIGGDSPIGRSMSALGLDGERLMILGLMLILLNEKADMTLLMALFYLLI